MSERKETLDLGVVLERRETDNPWIDHSWHAVAMIVGAAPLDPLGPWRRLTEGEGWVQFHAGTLPLELFRRETEGYKVNLSQDPPRIFVVLRQVEEPESPHDLAPFLITVCPYEAQDYLDAGEDLVEVVVMPDAVAAFVKAYCDRHHVEEPFYKRKRKRHDPQDVGFGRPPPGASRNRRGNGRGNG